MPEVLPCSKRALTTAWIWHQRASALERAAVLESTRPLGPITCGICADIPEYVPTGLGIGLPPAKRYPKSICADACVAQDRLKNSANGACEKVLRTFLAEADDRIEQQRLGPEQVNVEEAGPSEDECSHICTLKCSRAAWTRSRLKTADCGLVAVCCRHGSIPLNGASSMPVPENHMMYYELFDALVVRTPSNLAFVYLDISCNLGEGWRRHAGDAHRLLKMTDDELAKALDPEFKVRCVAIKYMHICVHIGRSCRLHACSRK